MHSFINAQQLSLKFARPTDLPQLLSLFWIKAVGAMFSLMAVVAMVRLVLVAGHFEHEPALALALPWVPSSSWLAAGLMLLQAARRPQPA